ncbi:MAG: asparagine synthase (glutamine-hydrolyzing) [bacterium]|nr:asparagine synthase (glutamine-hydrolyzing) [bacterium]
MCGVAGIFDRFGRPIDPATCVRMTEVLRHRGPDDEGTLVDSAAGVSIGLAHTRLAIVDLSAAGRQPMSSPDGDLWLVANGEIYNAPELRRELESEGCRFSSRTDIEVILHLYAREGLACLERLDGMFAFGLWDRGRGKLLLARDRFGVKPLYFAERAGRLAFASEAKAILEVDGFEARLDPVALSEHFTFQWATGGRSLFHGFELLEPGCWLEADARGTRRGRYFELRYDRGEPFGESEAVERLRAAFESAVERQLMSDVPLGAFLSGGMDTGSIVAVAGRRLGRLHTFTCGFDTTGMEGLESYFDERRESRELSALLDTEHHELLLGPDRFEPSVPSIVYHLDEPRVGICHQVYHVAELIGRHLKVVLSGVGGDELFAGYPWRYQPILGETDADRFAETYYRRWVRFFDDSEKSAFFSDRMLGEIGDFSTFDSFRQVLDAAGTDDPLHKALYFDFSTFLHGLFLVDDKLSMAHSVEARVPFMDNALLDLATRIPSRLKLSEDRPWKYVLKKAMHGLLPEETLHRRKQGFTPPDATWYRGPHRRYLESVVLSPRALERDVFRPEAVRKIFDQHMSGEHNHRFLIWSLLCLEWWHRIFVDGERPGID